MGQSKANKAIEATSQAEQNAVTIANKTLSTANQDLMTANKSVAEQALGNNISAAMAKNDYIEDIIESYDFCNKYPNATFQNGTTCKEILVSTLPYPTQPYSLGHKLGPSFLIAATATALIAIMALLNC